MNLQKRKKSIGRINLTIKERIKDAKYDLCSKVVIAGYAIKTKKNFLLVSKKLLGKI